MNKGGRRKHTIIHIAGSSCAQRSVSLFEFMCTPNTRALRYLEGEEHRGLADRSKDRERERDQTNLGTMGRVARRNAKAVSLADSLRRMYDECGADIVDPPTRATSESCFKYIPRIQSSLEPRQVCILLCDASLRDAFDDHSEWFRCGAMCIQSHSVMTLGWGADATVVDSMRVNFNKGEDAVSGCGICGGDSRHFTCRACWHGVCRGCFARAQLHAAHIDVWRCPCCRRTTPITNALQNMDIAERFASKSPFAAIRDAVHDLGGPETDLTVLSATTSERLGVRAGRRVTLCDTDDTRRVAKHLHSPGTIMMVGEVAELCECCGELQGDMDSGRVFIVDEDGDVVEMCDMFACMSALVRAIFS